VKNAAPRPGHETHCFTPSQDEVWTLMVRSAATPRVSNHEATMRDHRLIQSERASEIAAQVASVGATSRAI
jgi:hypothetical protein